MFLGLQGEYICIVSEDREEIENIKEIAGITEIRETNEPVERIDGEFIVGNDNIKNKMSNMRALAYTAEVDPITSHIQRLRDEEQTPEIVAEIEELKAERDAKVEEVRQRYPYPVDPITEEKDAE